MQIVYLHKTREENKEAGGTIPNSGIGSSNLQRFPSINNSNHYRAIWSGGWGGGRLADPVIFAGFATRGETRVPKRVPPPPSPLTVYARKSSSIHEFRLKPQSDVIRAKGNGWLGWLTGEIIENVWERGWEIRERGEADANCRDWPDSRNAFDPRSRTRPSIVVEPVL